MAWEGDFWRLLFGSIGFVSPWGSPALRRLWAEMPSPLWESSPSYLFQWRAGKYMSSKWVSCHVFMFRWVFLLNKSLVRWGWLACLIVILGFRMDYSQGWASLVAQMVKNLPAMQEIWVRSGIREDPLEKGVVTHSSILAWRIPWTEEPRGLQSPASQRVRQDWGTNTPSHSQGLTAPLLLPRAYFVCFILYLKGVQVLISWPADDCHVSEFPEWC